MSSPIMKFRKEAPALARSLDEQGWQTGLSRKGHIKFTSPEGKVVYVSGTPSDRRVYMNIVSDFRRCGLRLNQDFVREYTPPKAKPLPKETLAAMAESAKNDDIVDVAPDEFWNSAQVVAYLVSSNSEVVEFREAGLLPLAHNPNGHQRGKYYLANDVRRFAESEEFRTLRKTTGVKRGPNKKKNEVQTEAPVDIGTPPEIEAVRMVVARRSMEETSLDELADALAEALAPKLQDMISNAVRDYMRNVQW